MRQGFLQVLHGNRFTLVRVGLNLQCLDLPSLRIMALFVFDLMNVIVVLVSPSKRTREAALNSLRSLCSPADSVAYDGVHVVVRTRMLRYSSEYEQKR